MNPAPALLIFLAALLAGCASSRNSPEAEWQRAQCRQIVDRDAMKQCLERVDR
jgi:hypothetical protein